MSPLTEWHRAREGGGGTQGAYKKAMKRNRESAERARRQPDDFAPLGFAKNGAWRLQALAAEHAAGPAGAGCRTAVSAGGVRGGSAPSVRNVSAAAVVKIVPHKRLHTTRIITAAIRVRAGVPADIVTGFL